jgi:hypothetical protein
VWWFFIESKWLWIRSNVGTWLNGVTSLKVPEKSEHLRRCRLLKKACIWVSNTNCVLGTCFESQPGTMTVCCSYEITTFRVSTEHSFSSSLFYSQSASASIIILLIFIIYYYLLYYYFINISAYKFINNMLFLLKTWKLKKQKKNWGSGYSHLCQYIKNH